MLQKPRILRVNRWVYGKQCYTIYMNIGAYLPSAQFAVIVAAVAISGGIVWGANRIAHPPAPSLGPSQGESSSASSWNTQFGDATAFTQTIESGGVAQNLIFEAKTSNLTETIGRALVINFGAATGQGLGGDQPTQEKIVQSTLSEITGSTQVSVHDAHDLTLIAANKDTLRAFGNQIITALAKHPKATYSETMLPISIAIDTGDSSSLSSLNSVAKEYRSLANDVAGLETPSTFSSLVLQLANNYEEMARAALDMQQAMSDPARGLLGIQNYSALYNKNLVVFTQIAQTLQNNGILFNNKEPGVLLSVFLAYQRQAQVGDGI